MRKRIVTTASLLLLATPFCFAKGYTLVEANSIIVILIIIVIVLVVMGCYGLHYNKIISRRNEQMQRILTVLDEYRALVGDGVLTLDEQAFPKESPQLFCTIHIPHFFPTQRLSS